MIIEVTNISKSYRGKQLFRDLSASISSDSSYLVTGEKGSGKTTFTRILLNLEEPDSGNVELLGDYKYAWINTGVVFQEDRLCEGFSAAENVALVGRNTSPAVALEEMEKLITPEIYERTWDSSFSGSGSPNAGTKSIPEIRTALTSLPVRDLPAPLRRLVCIVRACIIPSDVLIMDEPFAGLDEDTRRAAITYIRGTLGTKPLVITGSPADAAAKEFSFCKKIALQKPSGDAAE